MMADSFLLLAQTQVEIVKRAKCFKICCYNISKVMARCVEFDEIILVKK